MNDYGSDKGNGWHNYTRVYDFLFSSIRGQPLHIFELGLGTTSLEFPSSMGPNGKPCASLYGWRDYFPRAEIYGADIDRDILIQEPRIHTFYVNQCEEKDIQHLWTQISPPLDILILDGLHEVEANVTFLKYSLHKMKKDGLCIIEDAKRSDVNQLTLLLTNQFPHYSHQVLDIPGANTQDNILCVVRRRPTCIPHSDYITTLHAPYDFGLPALNRSAFDVGFFCMCSYQPVAWEASLQRLRLHYPHAPIVLLNDGLEQYNYSEMAKKYNCIYLVKPKQLLLHWFDTNQVLEFFQRLYECAQLLGTTWMVHWHADMLCQGQVRYLPPGPLCGVGFGGVHQNGKANNHWDSHPRVRSFLSPYCSELNGWGSAGGSILHIETFYRVYWTLPSLSLQEIRDATWIDAFKHDDTTLAILFARCGYPYRVWKENVEQTESRAEGMFVHGYKQDYDYVRKGTSLSEHHQTCAKENQTSYAHYSAI
jgi:hypothetical protein